MGSSKTDCTWFKWGLVSGAVNKGAKGLSRGLRSQVLNARGSNAEDHEGE